MLILNYAHFKVFPTRKRLIYKQLHPGKSQYLPLINIWLGFCFPVGYQRKINYFLMRTYVKA